MIAVSAFSDFMKLAGASPQEISAVAYLPWKTRRIVKRKNMRSVNERPTSLFVVLNGWAGRYSLRQNGSRRFTGFMLPGDFCWIHAATGSDMDHSILAITECLIAELPAQLVDLTTRSSPALAKALWAAKLIEEAVLRKWLLNSDDAERATSHLLCELYTRSDKIGQVHQGTFDLPLTQADIGEALGMTAVHVNRIMQRLRRKGLIEARSGRATISDFSAISAHCRFDPTYLSPGKY